MPSCSAIVASGSPTMAASIAPDGQGGDGVREGQDLEIDVVERQPGGGKRLTEPVFGGARGR